MASSTTRFTTNPPRVCAFNNVGGSVPSGVWTRVPWGAADGSDYESMRSATGITVPAAGRYLIAFSVSFAGNASGARWAQVRRGSNGSATAGAQVIMARFLAQSAGTSSYVTASRDAAALAAGEVLELFTYQSSGAALALNPGAAETWISVRWVALD